MRLPSASYNTPGRSPSRLLNVYAQQAMDKGPYELVGAPGVRPFCALNGAGRGLFVMRGTLYAVAGTYLYRIDEVGSETNLGSMTDGGKLTFAGNGTEIVFSNKYIYSGGTLNPITDPDMPAVTAIDYLDGRVVYAQTGTQIWGASTLYAGSTYDGLDFASAEAWPDDIVTLKVDHRQVLLFGQETTEIWWNAGVSGFPFERLAGGFIEYGCLARLGVAKQDNSVFWLANDRTIRRLTGQTPVRVSQHGVEEKLSQYSRVDDCEAFPLNWDGHLFVVFRFPEAGACWVFDVTTGEWHERQTYGSSTWNISDAAQCYGKMFVQNAITGDVGYLSDSTYTEFGTQMVREVTYPSVYDKGKRLFHSMLDLTFNTGDAPVGVTPKVQLDFSNDGGNNWVSLADRSIDPSDVGAIGDYGRVVRWSRLGTARDRVYRVRMSDNAPFHLLDTQLEALGGNR